MDEQIEGQNSDGTLKPPTGHESTEVKVEGLAHAEPQGMKMLTMDEADLLRAYRAFTTYEPTHQQREKLVILDIMGHDCSNIIIGQCPAGKERSQALGSIYQAVLWAKEAIKLEAGKNEVNS